MRKVLEKLFLYLLRKVSREEWEKKSSIMETGHGRVNDHTLVTIDGDGPGVVMKIYCPNDKPFQLLEQLREEFMNSDVEL